MATGTSYPNNMCAVNNNCKSKWDLPAIINLNARSLSIEKLDELKVTVAIHDVSVVCVSETWFKDYMGNDSLNLHGFNLERKDRKNGRAGGVACYLRCNFLKTHYRFVQIVNVGTRGNAVLDKIWTNMDKLYMSPITLSELGKSDHTMVLLKPGGSLPCTTGSVMRVTTRAMGENEKAMFDRALSAVSWEPLFRLETCEEQYAYYHTMIDSLMEMCFPYKVVTRHSADKPWVTDGFRLLVRKRQRAHMSGNFVQEKILRNKVNRAATKLRYYFYQKHVTALSDTGSHDWWKNMKKLMGIEANDSSKMQGLANKVADGNCEMLANSMNDFFVSVSEHLPRLNVNNEVFAVEGKLPDEFIISIQTTFKALRNIKSNKASGPDNTPAWVLKDHAALLAPPLTAIFNCSLREGKLPNEWKMANIIPLPKSNPPASIHKDIRPISLTPIAAKVFESIVMEWVDNTIVSNVDPKQFGGLAGTSTTDALVEMTHKWYEATDTLNTYVRIVLLDFSKAFDLRVVVKHTNTQPLLSYTHHNSCPSTRSRVH